MTVEAASRPLSSIYQPWAQLHSRFVLDEYQRLIESAKSSVLDYGIPRLSQRHRRRDRLVILKAAKWRKMLISVNLMIAAGMEERKPSHSGPLQYNWVSAGECTLQGLGEFSRR